MPDHDDEPAVHPHPPATSPPNVLAAGQRDSVFARTRALSGLFAVVAFLGLMVLNAIHGGTWWTSANRDIPLLLVLIGGLFGLNLLVDNRVELATIIGRLLLSYSDHRSGRYPAYEDDDGVTRYPYAYEYDEPDVTYGQRPHRDPRTPPGAHVRPLYVRRRGRDRGRSHRLHHGRPQTRYNDELYDTNEPDDEGSERDH